MMQDFTGGEMLNVVASQDSTEGGGVKTSKFKLNIKNKFTGKSRMSTISFLVPSIIVVIAIVFLGEKRLQRTEEIPLKASEDVQANLSEFPSNQLLVKLTPEGHGKAKRTGNPNDTGIPELDKSFRDNKVSSFEQLAKESSKSNNPSADVFRWYLVTLDTSEERITGKLNALNRLSMSLPNGKDNRSDATDQAQSQLQSLVDELAQQPEVDAVELNYIATILTIPNDTYADSQQNGSWATGAYDQAYEDLWGMKITQADQAWDVTTGSSDIIVASIDTGVDYSHEDLAANMWVNEAEIPGNGVDDDSNGYVDDYQGWDWWNDDNDPMDDHGHGTHTSGTIGAVGNNGIGVAGVAWNVKIMPLKFLHASGSGYYSDAISAITYATDMGAHISSNSWGGPSDPTQALDDAFRYAYDSGVISVAAAGNSQDDVLDHTPANIDGVISVSATNHLDNLSGYSSYGIAVDVAAPGGDSSYYQGSINDQILSLKSLVSPMCPSTKTVDEKYCIVIGTSMATPHVSGLAALILSVNPTLTNEEVRQVIRLSSEDIGASGKDPEFGYGRINMVNAVNMANSQPLAPVITTPITNSVISGNNTTITGTIGGSGITDFSNYVLEIGYGDNPQEWAELASDTSTSFSHSINTFALEDGVAILRVGAFKNDGTVYHYEVYRIEVDNVDIKLPRTFNMSHPTANVIGTAQTKNGLELSGYTVEWGVGSDPSQWSTEGITLNNNGLLPVENGVLATWDNSSLQNGSEYSLKLTVNSPFTSVSYMEILELDQDLIPNWPVLIPGFGDNLTPNVNDLDSNGIKELIVASDKNIYVFNQDGSNFANFPIQVDSELYFINFTEEVNVADLDNDGYQEIITRTGVSGGSLTYIITTDNGTDWYLHPSWPGDKYSLGNTSPAIGDLNQDGTLEIVIVDHVTTNNFDIHAFSLDGQELEGFPARITVGESSISHSQAAIVDIDNNGSSPEILINLRYSIIVADNTGVKLLEYVLPDYNGEATESLGIPMGANVDNDNEYEIIFMGNVGRYGGAKMIFYALNVDGSVVNKWPFVIGTMNLGSHDGGNTPSAIDENNTGKHILYAGAGSTGGGLVKIDNSQASYLGSYDQVTQPAISDIDGDGKVEILTSYKGTVKIIDDDGSVMWDRSFPVISYDSAGDPIYPYFFSPGAFTDFDGDGGYELILPVTGWSWAYQYEYLDELPIFIWKLPFSTSNTQSDWPMFSHDPQRTSILKAGTSPSPTFTPTPTLTSTLTPIPTPTNAVPTPTNIPAPTPTDIPQTAYCSYCFKGVCDGVCHPNKDDRSLCPDCTDVPGPTPPTAISDCSNFCFKGVCDNVCHPNKDNQYLCPDCPGYVGSAPTPTPTPSLMNDIINTIQSIFQPLTNFIFGFLP